MRDRDVPGSVATLRLVDWNKDGLTDILASGMGDNDGGGGGVFLFVNTGKKAAPAFAEPRVLIAPGDHAGRDTAVRPDSSYYADTADFDGDGDLDLVVGGYSNWKAKEPVLTQAQKERVSELQRDLAECERAAQVLYDALEQASKSSDETAEQKHREEFSALSKRRTAIHEELDPLVGGEKHAAYVWLYENTGANTPATAR